MAGGTKYANIGVRKESADRIEKMEQTIANQTAAHKIPDILVPPGCTAESITLPKV